MQKLARCSKTIQNSKMWHSGQLLFPSDPWARRPLQIRRLAASCFSTVWRDADQADHAYVLQIEPDQVPPGLRRAA
jgi:hypothetical protein